MQGMKSLMKNAATTRLNREPVEKGKDFGNGKSK